MFFNLISYSCDYLGSDRLPGVPIHDKDIGSNIYGPEIKTDEIPPENLEKKEDEDEDLDAGDDDAFSQAGKISFYLFCVKVLLSYF